MLTKKLMFILISIIIAEHSTPVHSMQNHTKTSQCDDKKECISCFIEKADNEFITLPCEHKNCCEQCLADIYVRHKQGALCPLCRKPFFSGNDEEDRKLKETLEASSHYPQPEEEGEDGEEENDDTDDDREMLNEQAALLAATQQQTNPLAQGPEESDEAYARRLAEMYN